MTDQDDSQAWEVAQVLCDAGILRAVRRAGLKPSQWKEELDLELDFEGAAGLRTFRVSVGAIGASDLLLAEGAALELSYGHLRTEEPESYAETVSRWSIAPEEDAQWAIGARLLRPERLEMSVPYVMAVGFKFACEREGRVIGHLMLFGEADLVFAVGEEHPEVANYGLRVV